ncbi:Uncharacterised protein g8671 [Pycnogonum litorale]
MAPSSRLRGYLTISGLFLIMNTLGSLYTWGNMTTYVTSYMRRRTDPELSYTDTVWVLSAATSGLPLMMVSSGYLVRWIGVRPTLFVGCTLMSACQLGLKFVLDAGFVPFTIVFMMSYMFGGISYMTSVLCGMRWFPQNKGVVSGLVIGAFGLGSLMLTPIQTAFINPENLSPDEDGTYFSQPEVLDRVPLTFYMLSGLYYGVQLLGIAMVTEARPDDGNDGPQERRCLVKDADSMSSSEEVKRGSDKVAAAAVAVVDHEYGLKPRQVLKTRKFYVFWTAMFLNCIVTYYMNSMYKVFGQTFISDDYFLALVGALSAGFSFVARLFWGRFYDRFSYKVSLLTISTLLAILLCTFVFTPYGGGAMFAVWFWSISFSFSGMYVISPCGVTEAFGDKYGESNYGMVFTSQILNGPVAAIISQSLTPVIDWLGTFLLLGALSILAFITGLFFKADQVLIGSG